MGITQRMKIFASFALISNTVALSLIGVHPIGAHSNFQKNNPWLYKHLQFLGLKTPDHMDGKTLTQPERLDLIRNKLITTALYLIVSILMYNYFQTIKIAIKCEQSWTNEDFQKLYEYTSIIENSKKKKKKDDDHDDRDDEEVQRLMQENKTIPIETFKKKKTYTKYDLEDRYNFRRWQTQFIVFELLDWWPTMDNLAVISPLIHGTLFMYIALYKNVSAIMFVLVASQGHFFYVVAKKTQVFGNNLSQMVSILTQIDIKYCTRLCKFYNEVSLKDFYETRTSLWNFQLKVVQFMAILASAGQVVITVREIILRDELIFKGFPDKKVLTEIVDKDPLFLDKDPLNLYYSIIKVTNKIDYWLYFSGLYAGNDPQAQKDYVFYIAVLFLALFIDKSSVNWLKNRWGCSYFNFQKFVELSTRRKAIKEKWELLPIPYKPEHYKYHNFYKPFDFEIVYSKFFEKDGFAQRDQEDIVEANQARQEDQRSNPNTLLNPNYKEGESSEFIPYKVAKRAKQIISFSLRVNGRDHSLEGGFDQDTDAKLDDLFDHIDTEHEFKDIKKELSKNREELINLKKLQENQMNNRELQTQVEEQEEKITSIQAQYQLLKQKTEKRKYDDFDIEEKYEEIQILKKYKIDQLEEILKGAITTKYKISYYKGIMFFYEALIMITLMISIALKSNVFSLVYLFFVIRYPFCEIKHYLFLRLCFYLSISLSIQYALYWLNLTKYTEISNYPFPNGFEGYPFKQLKQNPNYMNDEGYPFPIMFAIESFVGKQNFMQQAYFLGIGINSVQLENLFVDFFNLFLIMMYILSFRNPIFEKNMRKVFWKYPNPNDDPEQWNRLDEDVKKQQEWAQDPLHITDRKYDTIRKERNFSEFQLQAMDKVHMIYKRQEPEHYDYDMVLVNYVDMKYQEIWSSQFVKKIKNQLKDQISYYRIVKQGSQVFYLGFHIITIFIVILLSIMRQSLISLVYLLVIVIKIMYNVEDALKERSQNLVDEISQFEDEIKKNVQDLKRLEDQNETQPTLDKDEQILELKQLIEQQTTSLKQDRFIHLKANSADKRNNKQDNSNKKKKPNTLPHSFKYALQILVIIDFCSQIICQMPFIQLGPEFEKFGFRKIWSTGIPGEDQKDAFDYVKFMDGTTKYTGLQLLSTPLILQILNCIMIVFVFSQVSIFDSPGYQKYVTQKDGSLNLLLQLSILKGKSVAYRFNNFKILKIIKIQKEKELVTNNFEELKQRMKNWRIMKKQTLDMGINGVIDLKQEIDDEMKQQSAERKKEQISRKTTMLKTVSESFGEDQNFSSCDESDNLDNVEVVIDDEVPTLEEKEKFLRRMSKTIVQSKIKNINYLVSIYQFIHKNWIEQIFFKNRKEEVEKLVDEHSQGSIDIPTELERIMEDETYDYVSSHFQNSSSTTDNELNKLCSKFKKQEEESHENIDFKIMDILEAKISEESRLKLKDMTRTWEFTRPRHMCWLLYETLCYLYLSQIQYIIYMMMIYSTYENAGMITIIYPFMIFGVALLEETRPTKTFWKVLKFWTTVVLFLKFFANIKWTPATVAQHFTHKVGLDKASAVFHEAHLKQENFMNEEFWGYVKLGLFSYNSIQDITVYILPEVIILCLLMVNSIYLRMLGFRNQSEDDIEDVKDGIHRSIERGDIDKVKEMQKLDCNMNLQKQFPSVQALKKQKKKEDAAFRELELQKFEINKNYKMQEPNANLSQQDRLSSLEVELKMISQNIKNSTRNFKLETNEQENENYQKYVDNKLFQKVLDDDSICFIEGSRLTTNDDDVFVSKKECEEDYMDLIKLEVMSGGDNEVEINQKSERIKLRNKPSMGLFGKVKYFNRLFPDLKIQKPGYDLYGSTNIFLTIMILFVFTFYGEFNVSENRVIPGKQASNTFSNGLIFLVLFIIICMLLERVANRTATKAAAVNTGLEVENGHLEQGKCYWVQESLVYSPNKNGQKKNYTRWNRGLHNEEDPRKKIKLSDKASLNYLQDLQQENKTNRTKISRQQKLKYILHMGLLFLVHAYVFWFVPITGNMNLYGTPQCDQEKKKYYGCKDFHQNPTLKIFYIVLCMYLFLSAMQIKFGLPIRKMPSSVLQYNDNIVAYGASNIYMALPFILEIRTLIDFSFAQTSLDIFQFWEIYQANFDMYNAKNGNIYYFQKNIGEPMECFDRCLLGFTFSFIVLAILVGPLILFSPLAGFVAPNPVLNTEMNVQFLITRQLSDLEMKKFVTGNMDATLQEYDSLNVTSLTQTTDDTKKKKNLKKEDEDKCMKLLKSKDCTTDWYEIFTQKNPQMRALNSTLKDESKFKDWTESRFFQADQIQLCLLSEYPDKKWEMSPTRRQNMRLELKRALDEKDPTSKLNLGFHMEFNRKNPPGSNHKAYINQLRALNTSLIHDCQTRKQLLEFTDFDCKEAMKKDKNAHFDITYYEAFSPYIILGDTKNASLLMRKSYQHEEKHQEVKQMMHDVKLTYMCAQDEWEVVSSVNSTHQSLARNKAMMVDPETCKYKDSEYSRWFDELSDEKEFTNINRDVTYQRVSLMLFSMLISSSFLASYSLTTFYVGVVFVLGSTVRSSLIWPSYKAWQYEAVETDSVLKLVDYVYNKRYEEDLVGEEEGYRMLREILHQQEFFKSICGSCLRGTLDPSKDFLSQEDDARIKQIEQLEARGFEVKNLKQKILQNAANKLELQQDEAEQNMLALQEDDDNFKRIQ